MNTRREFIRIGAGAAMALGGGCRLFVPGRSDANVIDPPYGDTIRDRLWMFGHVGKAFDKPFYTFKIPPAEPIEMNDACKRMGIPNVCVCRYAALPKNADCAAYFRTFTDIRRIAFSIVDSAVGTWRQKYSFALELRREFPNLNTLWLDDFFIPDNKGVRPIADFAAFRRQADRDGFKIGIVMYPDQEGVKREFKDVLDLCDQISVWFWHGKSIPTMKENVARVRELVGPEKALIMGVYLWDFGGKKPIPDEQMLQQLETGRELMMSRELSGLIFHPTSIVSRKLSSVELARKWIAENGETRC